VDTLTQEKKLLEWKLAAVNKVFELEVEQQHGDNIRLYGDTEDDWMMIGDFLDDDDSDRKQQPRSFHDNVESTFPHDKLDSGSHHGNQKSTSLQSQLETWIRHDNGEAVSFHSTSDHHHNQQQAGVHCKSSWGLDKDTGMVEEQDEGKDTIETDSADNVMYGDDGDEQQQP
jgi:hypothetical protein